MEPIWTTWQSQLSKHPAATDNLAAGVFKRPRHEALSKRYLEMNPFGRVSWLMFDIDHEGGFEFWEDVGLPPPNVYVQNRHNLKAHLGYALATPVGTTGLSREKPIRFTADIQRGMTKRLVADRAYINRFAHSGRMSSTPRPSARATMSSARMPRAVLLTKVRHRPLPEASHVERHVRAATRERLVACLPHVSDGGQ